MKFNLGFTAITAAAAVATIGHLAADVANGRGVRFMLLLLCLACVAAVAVRRVLQRGQEPAFFVAGTYLSFGAVVAIAEAVAGDYTLAVMIAIGSPILVCSLAEDPRTRRWVNRIARYPGTHLRDDRK